MTPFIETLVYPCAVGRTTISPTSTSEGCSMANAIALATAAGGIAIFSIDARIYDRISGFVMDDARSVLTKPGEIVVTRSLSPASWRGPFKIARTAFFEPA
jgi:hypothetical protein